MFITAKGKNFLNWVARKDTRGTRCPGAGVLQEAKKKTGNSPAFVVSMS